MMGRGAPTVMTMKATSEVGSKGGEEQQCREPRIQPERVGLPEGGQLLMATTIAPTRAIRTHNNSLSPQRFMRVRIFIYGLPANERCL